MSERAPYGPTVQLARLWSGVSAKGVARLSGRLGNARLTVLPAREEDWEGEAARRPTRCCSRNRTHPRHRPRTTARVDLAFLEQRTSARGKDYLAVVGRCQGHCDAARDARGRADPLVLRLTGKAREPPGRPRRARRSIGRPLAQANGSRQRCPSGAQASGHAARARRTMSAREPGPLFAMPIAPGSSGCGYRRRRDPLLCRSAQAAARSGHGAVAKCVGNSVWHPSDDENIGSSCQVNALRDGLLGKRLPTIDLAHVNLA